MRQYANIYYVETEDCDGKSTIIAAFRWPKCSGKPEEWYLHSA